MGLTKNINLAQTIKQLYYAYVSDIESITNGSTNQYRVVSFRSGKDWKQLYYTPGSANFNEIEKNSNAGIEFKQVIKAFYPGEDDSNSQDIDPLVNRPILIKLVYSSSQKKLIGTSSIPAILSSDLSVNKKTGRSVTINCITNQRAPWLEEI